MVEDLSWKTIYLLPRLCTISTNIRNFQFKFLHSHVATNTFLFKVGISDTALCFLCKTDKETFLGMLGNKNPLGKSSMFFCWIHLIAAWHVLDIYECLVFKGETATVCSSQGIIFNAVNLRTSLHLSENIHNSWNIT